MVPINTNKEYKDNFYSTFKNTEDLSNLVKKLSKETKDIRNLLNTLYEKKEIALEKFKNLKKKFHDFKEENNPKIQKFFELQEDAYKKMADHFERSQAAWTENKKALAKELSNKGREYEKETKAHTKDRQNLVKERNDLRDKYEIALYELEQITEQFNEADKKFGIIKKQYTKAEKDFEASRSKLKEVQEFQKIELEKVSPNIYSVLLKIFRDYYYGEYLHRKKEESRTKPDGKKGRYRWNENGYEVTVCDDFSIDQGVNTTDFVIRPLDSKIDHHLHIVFDENGRQIYCEWNKNH